jgi:hypothetical protein
MLGAGLDQSSAFSAPYFDCELAQFPAGFCDFCFTQSTRRFSRWQRQKQAVTVATDAQHIGITCPLENLCVLCVKYFVAVLQNVPALRKLEDQLDLLIRVF